MSHPTLFTVWGRKPIITNTDPQHRCYDGAHFQSEHTWSEWFELGNPRTEQEAIQSVKNYSKIQPAMQFRWEPPQTPTVRDPANDKYLWKE